MDIFVLPSLLPEGLPMSVLEAMGAGTTIVGTRVDGITDVIRDGQDGLLAAPGDADDFAGALAAIVRGQAHRDRLRFQRGGGRPRAFPTRAWRPAWRRSTGQCRTALPRIAPGSMRQCAKGVVDGGTTPSAVKGVIRPVAHALHSSGRHPHATSLFSTLSSMTTESSESESCWKAYYRA